MAAKLTSSSYGKSAVRLTRVKRLPDRHELIELEVAIELQGDFDDSYLAGDNRKIIATDTMKNTVYALAATHPIDAVEDFGIALARHFVERNSHVTAARVDLAQASWKRIDVDGHEHPHAFVSAGQHRRTARVTLGQEGEPEAGAGVEGLVILKTARSAFKGFLRDEFTTLADTDDRIFATRLAARWDYEAGTHDWNGCYDRVLSAMLRVFAAHDSLAVQQTLFAMAERALAECKPVRDIDLEMPNQHRIPVDLRPLGLDNRNEVFVTTSEPFGLIQARVSRG
jgi:urate oxidase